MGSDVEDAFNSIANIAVNLSTAGIVGFEDGEFGRGKTSEAVVDVLKDVTGAKAAEEANEAATARFEEQKTAAAKSRKEQQDLSARQQIVASRAAKSAQSTGSKATPSSKSKISSLGSDESDFLGL